MLSNLAPLVSVIMPAFNVGGYIEESLISIIEQDYSNVELIVVDDGSTDNTADVAEHVLSKHAGEHMLIRQENLGVSAARNRGIDYSNGEFYICIDPDDVLVRNAISSMVSYALESEASVVACDYFRFSTCPDVGPRYGEGAIVPRCNAVEGYYTRTLRMFAPGLLLSACIKQVARYEKDVRFEEDVMYVWDVLFASERVGYLNAQLYGYRRRPGSTMTSPAFDRIYDAAHSFESFFQEKACCNIAPESFYGRWLLGTLHVIALTSCYAQFKEAFGRLDAKAKLARIATFPQFKVRILVALSRIGVPILYAALYATRLLRSS